MKTATTIPEQINLLQSRGMTIADTNKAAEVLSDIGYYRLGFYWFPFEQGYPNWRNRTHTFLPGASFETALTLYYFDQDLRHILIPYLQRVEIHLRTTLIYLASNHYKRNPTWFSDPNIVKQKFLSKLLSIYQDIKDQNKVIQRHHSKYRNDIYAPAWKTIEYMTFGNVLFLIDNLRNTNLQDSIIAELGYGNYDVFASQMYAFRVLRNKCAHGHNLFDLNFNQSIKPGPVRGLTNKQRHSINGAIKILAHVLDSISQNRSREMVDKINALINSDKNNSITNIISSISA